FPEFIEKPRDFIEASIDSTLLSSKKLEAHIKRLKDNGLSVTDELAAFHHKRAFPWQSLVIMFITIPFLGRTGNVRESLAKKILLCLICVLSYHVFSAVFLALGKSGILFPFVSAWLASFLFTVGGICFFEKANY
ncbi:MAG: LptF/LptG family permease, partial [Candidatus Omnitrophota bacterium]